MNLERALCNVEYHISKCDDIKVTDSWDIIKLHLESLAKFEPQVKSQLSVVRSQITNEKIAGNIAKEEYYKGYATGLQYAKGFLYVSTYEDMR